jgi:predicted MFS family arabinose efflux permease
VARYVPESRDPDAKGRLDFPGAALSFAGLGSVIYGLIAAPRLGWASAPVAGSVSTGMLLLVVFVLHERRSAAPMMPLRLFRSRAFAGVNLLTLFLYGALGGAFFFVPFLLVQVHHYAATAVGASFLPFTLVLGVFSRWAGGLVDRVGARLPLVAGPAIAAAGFALLAWPGAGGAYATTFLWPMTVLGIGMVVTVAPLTTTVINAVPAHQVGVASGINNAVAAVASLLAIAVLGAIATTLLDRSLDRHLERGGDTSTTVHEVVDGMRGGLVAPALPDRASDEDRRAIEAVTSDALLETLRRVLLATAALALVGAASAALTIRGRASSG